MSSALLRFDCTHAFNWKNKMFYFLINSCGILSMNIDRSIKCMALYNIILFILNRFEMERDAAGGVFE